MCCATAFDLSRGRTQSKGGCSPLLPEGSSEQREKTMPKARKPVETYPNYLRRVGADYKASGSEFTAEDYFKSADVIEKLSKHLMAYGVREKDLLNPREEDTPSLSLVEPRKRFANIVSVKAPTTTKESNSEPQAWGVRKVMSFTGLGRTTIWRLCEAGKFPAPHYLLRNRTWWRSEVEAWVQKNIKPTSDAGESLEKARVAKERGMS